MRKMIIEKGSGPEMRSSIEDAGCGTGLGRGIRVVINKPTTFSADACAKPEDVDIVDEGFGSPSEDPGEILKRAINGGKYL